jgi:hypothetical protein
MNFFKIACQEPATTDIIFGICDDINHHKAYTVRSNPETWIATVKNDKSEELIFTAVDKCVLKGSEFEGRARCDCMITSKKHLYFIELKEQKSKWITHAVDQLESTIQMFIENHEKEISSYIYKKAFACNRKSGHFHIIDNEDNKIFFDRTGFRLDIQAEIIVV